MPTLIALLHTCQECHTSVATKLEESRTVQRCLRFERYEKLTAARWQNIVSVPSLGPCVLIQNEGDAHLALVFGPLLAMLTIPRLLCFSESIISSANLPLAVLNMLLPPRPVPARLESVFVRVFLDTKQLLICKSLFPYLWGHRLAP